MGIQEARLARETVAFVKKHILDKDVLGNSFVAAKAKTEHFKEEEEIALFPRKPEELHTTHIEVTREKSLVLSERLHQAGFRQPCVLNFADALDAGGLFFQGATTQEEGICRATALFSCIDGHTLYERNQKCGARDGLALHDMLYTPDLVVFRDPSTEAFLREDRYHEIAVVTSAAPNVYMTLGQFQESKIKEIFDERIRRMLTIMSNKRHEAIVLGAWGCGAFGNQPHVVATAFHEAIRKSFQGHFKKIAFAIYDRYNTSPNISIFREILTPNT